MTTGKRHKFAIGNKVGKQFTKDYQPSGENKSKGMDIAYQKRKFRDTLAMVITQSLSGVKDNVVLEKAREQVKKLYPDISDEDINYGISTFASCFLEIQKTKDMRQLKTAFEIAGMIEEKPTVEVNTNIDIMPEKVDIEKLKRIRKEVFDKE